MTRIVKVFLAILFTFFTSTGHSLASNVLDKHPKTKKTIVKNLEKAGITDANILLSDERIKLYPEIFKPSKGPSDDGYGLIFSYESIQRGKKFIADNEELLETVERHYNVPKEVIAAITRVETNFGNYLGRLEVVNAILTWIIHGKWYRRSMFERELSAWLAACQKNGFNPFLKGSVCGAFGLVQFMPSSYQRWAVDWDGDGKSDLHTMPDAMASCANYLVVHGWGQKQSSQWSAVMAYNRDRAYTRAVLAYAKELRTWKLVKEKLVIMEPDKPVERQIEKASGE